MDLAKVSKFCDLRHPGPVIPMKTKPKIMSFPFEKNKYITRAAGKFLRKEMVFRAERRLPGQLCD